MAQPSTTHVVALCRTFSKGTYATLSATRRERPSWGLAWLIWPAKRRSRSAVRAVTAMLWPERVTQQSSRPF